MTSDTLILPFTRVPIFDGLPLPVLEQIARTAERVVYQAGDLIQREDDISDAAVLIVAGKVAIIDDEDPSTPDSETVAPGSLVGELAMLIETRCATTVIARSSVRAFRILRQDMRLLLLSQPAVAEHFAQQISQRLSTLADEMRRIDATIAASSTLRSSHDASQVH